MIEEAIPFKYLVAKGTELGPGKADSKNRRFDFSGTHFAGGCGGLFNKYPWLNMVLI